MSSPSIHHLESSSSAYIPSIEAFKSRMRHVLTSNKYVAEFGGSSFWNTHAPYVRFMVSEISLPQWVIDPEQVYMGGASMAVPNGFQQNNLDLTLYNTGPELQVMQNWIKLIYDQSSRTYGYFDDVKCDLKVIQFTTDGREAQTFLFTDCTIFQLGGVKYSYDQAAVQTFNVSLNYFGFTMLTENYLMEGLVSLNKASGAAGSGLAQKAATAAKNAGTKTK